MNPGEKTAIPPNNHATFPLFKNTPHLALVQKLFSGKLGRCARRSLTAATASLQHRYSTWCENYFLLNQNPVIEQEQTEITEKNKAPSLPTGASHHCSEPGTGKSPEPAGWKACATDRESSRLAAAMKAEGALAFVRVLGGRAAASRDGSRSGDSVKMRPLPTPLPLFPPVEIRSLCVLCVLARLNFPFRFAPFVLFRDQLPYPDFMIS